MSTSEGNPVERDPSEVHQSTYKHKILSSTNACTHFYTQKKKIFLHADIDKYALVYQHM